MRKLMFVCAVSAPAGRPARAAFYDACEGDKPLVIFVQDDEKVEAAIACADSHDELLAQVVAAKDECWLNRDPEQLLDLFALSGMDISPSRYAEIAGVEESFVREKIRQIRQWSAAAKSGKGE